MSYVTKRNGTKQLFQADKIIFRISKLITEYTNVLCKNKYLDTELITQKVISSLYPDITTEEIDGLTAEICANLSTKHPDYAYLGGKILVSNLHKKIVSNFSSTMDKLYQETNIINKFK